MRIFKATGIAAIGMIATGVALAAPKEISFGLFPPIQSSTAQTQLIPWMKWFHDQVGDEVMVKLYPGGSLGRHPVKQYKLVKDGVADIAFIVLGYTPGQFPDVSLFELPGLAKGANEGSLAIWRMHEMGLLRGFDDVKALSLSTTGAYDIHTREPMKSIADVKGLKIRTVGGVQKQVMESLGAIPVGMPITQVAESISRGLLGGAILDWTGYISFRVEHVAPHHYQSRLGVVPLGFVMNKQVYNGLSSRVRKVIDKSGEYLSRLGGEGFDKQEIKFKTRLGKDPKHTFIVPNAETLDRIYASFKPIHDSWIKKNGAERYNAYKKILADIREGR